MRESELQNHLSKRERRRSRALQALPALCLPALCLPALCLPALCLPALTASATPFVPWLNGEPTESQITALPPAPIRPKLSFQTRISQATLPILEGVFYEVVVTYKGLLAQGVDCEERFERVRVLDSVLNLELGLNARCDFAYAVAQRSALNLEVCFSTSPRQATGTQQGTQQETLPPRCFNQQVEIASAPYAIKVSRAREAQSVHQANTAFLTSYAYRVIDRSAPSVGEDGHRHIPPYLSFQTQAPSGLGLNALRIDTQDLAAREELSEAGYVRWHPHGGGASQDLYIARDPFSHLDALTLGARLVDWYGPHGPTPTSRSTADLEEGAPLVALSVRERLAVTGDLEVSAGRVVVTQRTSVDGGARVEGGGLYVDGSAQLRGALAVSAGLQQGWRAENLQGPSAGPRDAVQITGAPLSVSGDLSLSPLQKPDAGDSASHLQTADVTVSGPTTLAATAPVGGGGGAPQARVLGAVSVLGRAEVGAGGLEVGGALEVRGDGEVIEELQLGSSLALLRSGSPQPVITLQSDTLAINHDPQRGEGEPYFDEVRVRGDVQFAQRVTFDQPVLGVPSECQINPARDDQGKLIPQVFDLSCQGVTVRVSALLESDCGNGVREGEELCDDGNENLMTPVLRYCDPSSTPFDNCQFYRLIDSAGACTSSTVELGVVGSSTRLTFEARSFQGQCALQSPQDIERNVIGVPCAQGACLAQVTYPHRLCRADCTFTRCGDGVIDNLQGNVQKEQCDDGNLIDNDDCDNRCQYVSSCKLEVARRVEHRSALIPIDTVPPNELTTPPTTLSNEQRLLYYSTAECPQGGGPYPAPQRVVEVDLTEPAYVAFETYPDTQSAPQRPHPDTFLYLRSACDQVMSDQCDDDSGVGRLSALAPRRYEAGRHYVVVGGYADSAGQTLLGVKMTCAEPEKLIATVHHKAVDPIKDLVFQTNTALQGRRGYVPTRCLASPPPAGFVQPLDPSFNAASATTGLGARQVVIELVVERASALSVSADSLTLDPVIYLKSGCEAGDVLRAPNDPNLLLCNDNATGNAQFPLATLNTTLTPGVYYVVVDGDSLEGGLVNVSLTLENTP